VTSACLVRLSWDTLLRVLRTAVEGARLPREAHREGKRARASARSRVKRARCRLEGHCSLARKRRRRRRLCAWDRRPQRLAHRRPSPALSPRPDPPGFFDNPTRGVAPLLEPLVAPRGARATCLGLHFIPDSLYTGRCALRSVRRRVHRERAAVDRDDDAVRVCRTGREPPSARNEEARRQRKGEDAHWPAREASIRTTPAMSSSVPARPAGHLIDEGSNWPSSDVLFLSSEPEPVISAHARSPGA